MNGSRRTTCVADRARRTKRGNSAMAMATMAVRKPGPSAAAIITPSSSDGNDISRSENAAEQPIGPAAEIAGQHAGPGAGQRGQHRRRHADRQRGSVPSSTREKHVAAECVGAEPVLRRWSLAGGEEALFQRVVRHDPAVPPARPRPAATTSTPPMVASYCRRYRPATTTASRIGASRSARSLICKVIRGSIAAQSRSVSRFTSTTKNANTTSPACTIV